MKIKRIEPIAVSFPMKKPVFMAGVEIRQADNVLVRHRSRQRRRRLGRGGLRADHDRRDGREHDGGRVLSRAGARAAGGRHRRRGGGDDRRMYGNNAAKAAIEIALHDLVGRATSRPVYALLGGKRRSRMRDPRRHQHRRARRRPARRRATRRPRATPPFKIKVGIDKPLVDAERTRRVCALIGSGAADLVRRQPGLEHRGGRAIRARGRRQRA